MRDETDGLVAPQRVDAGPAAEPDPAALAEVEVRFPPGSYYSPQPDTRELAGPRAAAVWPPAPRETPGVDWNDAGQVALCRELARQQRLEFAHEPAGDRHEFCTSNDHNGMFKALDAWILEAILRQFEPARVVEVGAGFSSLVTARVKRELLPGMRFEAVEPHPREFLRDLPGLDELVELPVQEVPLERFASLAAGEVLFVDTSHVVKTGGDVPWIYGQLLPRLAPGVVVHLHDVFLPHDYPREWALEGWGWNEQYLVQAFLAFNPAFEVLFSAEWMLLHHEDLVLEAFPGWASYRDERPTRAIAPGPGEGPGPSWWNSSGSLWLRRSSAP